MADPGWILWAGTCGLEDVLRARVCIPTESILTKVRGA